MIIGTKTKDNINFPNYFTMRQESCAGDGIVTREIRMNENDQKYNELNKTIFLNQIYEIEQENRDLIEVIEIFSCDKSKCQTKKNRYFKRMILMRFDN